MSLARLLWERVWVAHNACGGPLEKFDEFMAGNGTWQFHALGGDGVIGIHLTPHLDGDAFVIALPTKPSHAAKLRALAIMRAHTASGRHLYTMAWKNHLLALNINRRVGGELLGFDAEGYLHFRHTHRSLTRGKEKHPQAA